MKEIKDKKIYKTASMTGSGFTYVEVFQLVNRWENAYGDRIICGEDVRDEVLERLSLTITRKDGVVYGSVCSVNQQNTITGIYHQSPLHELLGRLIENN